MKKNNLPTLAGMFLLLAAGFISCNKEVKQEEKFAGELPPTNNPAFMNLNGSTPAQTATPVQATAQATPAPSPVATAPGMNPPHGQPGHRCEIAVGAPLNSQPVPKGAMAQPQQTQPQPAQFKQPVQQAQSQPVVTAPGMNPPHGQPGHSCAIAVGAPLPK